MESAWDSMWLSAALPDCPGCLSLPLPAAGSGSALSIQEMLKCGEIAGEGCLGGLCWGE